MSKQMTVGKRIALGFSVVILIAVLLGGLGAWSMLTAKTDSTKLATEYVPEVKVATDLRGAANRVMYQMRGYGMTEDETYYEAAQQEIETVNQHLTEASELADKAIYLEALQGQVAEAEGAVEAYAALMEQTEKTIAAMVAQRTKLDQNAATYMQNCAEFLKGQNEAFKRDLDERQKKIEIATAIVDRGTQTRVRNFKAQGANDMDMLQEAVTLVRGVDDELKQLHPITRQQANIDQMNNIEAAAQKYAEAMQAYMKTNASLAVAGEKMNSNAAAYMANCAAFLASQNEKMNEEFGTEGANLQERLQKITLINDVIDAGNAARVMNFKAQATGSPELMREAIEKVQDRQGDHHGTASNHAASREPQADRCYRDGGGHVRRCGPGLPEQLPRTRHDPQGHGHRRRSLCGKLRGVSGQPATGVDQRHARASGEDHAGQRYHQSGQRRPREGLQIAVAAVAGDHAGGAEEFPETG